MAYGRYIVRRVVHFVPTLLLLVLLIGLLQNAMPGDLVEDTIRSGDFGKSGSQFKQRERYNALAKQLKIDQPAFYWTLGPKNKISSMSTGDVRFDKAKNIWLDRRNSDDVDRYFSSLRSLEGEIKEAEIDDVSEDGLLGLLYTIGQSGPNADVTAIQDRLQAQLRSNELTSDVVNLRDKALKSEMTFTGSLPALQWNGINNRFHQSIVALLSGDWGNSKIDGRAVTAKVGQALIWTILITFTALILALCMAILFSLWSSLYDGQTSQKILSLAFFGLYAVPLFWLATLFIVFLTTEDYGRWTDIFPAVGMFIDDGQSLLSGIWGKKQLLILPIICLALPASAYFYRFLLTGQRSERSKPYFVTARAKGLDHLNALLKHSFLNAAYPILGLLAVILPGLIGGSLIIEVIFNIPGMGRLMFQAIMTQDWNVVMGVVFLSAIISFLSFLATDLLLPIVNPKARAHG